MGSLCVDGLLVPDWLGGVRVVHGDPCMSKGLAAASPCTCPRARGSTVDTAWAVPVDRGSQTWRLAKR